MTDSQLHQVDLVIAGGGMAGVTLALALQKNCGLHVAIVEAQFFKQDETHPGFDARSLALAAHSCRVLKHIGLEDIEQLGSPIEHIHVSDRGYLGQCQLHATDYQLSSLGTVVELHTLGRHLHQLLESCSEGKTSWFCPDTITGVTQHQDSIELALKSGCRVSAKLLVVAEGGHSATRKLLNISDSQRPYEQVALIANVETSHAHKHWAYERFTESGPLALLPLPGESGETQSHRCSLVWTIPPDQQEKLMTMCESDFLANLQEAFGYRLGRFTKAGERFCYPLSLITADQHITHRAVVAGNASQSLHPIAGQGFNIGLRDVETLVGLIKQAQQQGKDIGEFAVLNAYQKSRKEDQAKVVCLTDGLVRLFSNHHLPLVIGRNLGLSLMNILPAAKSQLANQAMGMNGQLEGSEHAIF